MSLEAGKRFGAFEILAPLGAGGMGEVWRARDPRLNREVASSRNLRIVAVPGFRLDEARSTAPATR